VFFYNTQIMKNLILISIMFLLRIGAAFSHPGTGIVIDKYGNIYFIHTGVGIAKFSNKGILTYVHKSNDGHWMCLDERGIFSRTQPGYFERITKDGELPVIIYAGGGSPIAIGNDGNFYYCGGDNGDLNPGAKTLVRESPQNEQTIFSPSLQDTLNKLNEGITGIDASNSAIYVACWNSLLKVNMDGMITVLLHPIKVTDCDEDPADHKEANRGIPFLRGIAVDSAGTIYTAATSCHCLLKITPDGKVKTILKSERPWSPTGVALYNSNIYVLEYTNANGPKVEGWKPRVRRIEKSGEITTIIDLSIEK
jgi:hypothetical protein